MWFSFVATGAIVTLIIIGSLWEKFQTNPTITGLDTDYHSWDVPFPGITICLSSPASAARIEEYIKKRWGNDLPDEEIKTYTTFVNTIANFSYLNLKEITQFYNKSKLPQENYRQLLYDVVVRCEDFLSDCYFKGDLFECCKIFSPSFTDYGFCYSFNAMYSERNWPWKPSTAKQERKGIRYMFETDASWAIQFTANIDSVNSGNMMVFVHSNDELPGLELAPQHLWTNQIEKILFLPNIVYTTEEVRQLSIKQRKCVFKDEIKLPTADEYTYWACMFNCRVKYAMKKCSCIPYFHREVSGFPSCNLSGLNCLAQYSDTLTKGRGCSCELACDNAMYAVEKFTDMEEMNYTLEVGFVTWPMIRYKREVLFGWVDLLVSFGGIAGLFLGFSLLSAVEVVYYFTLRAICMVYKNREELENIIHKEETEPLPKIDLSLIPNINNHNLNSRSLKNLNKSDFVGQVVGTRARKNIKSLSNRKIPGYTVPFLN